MNTAGFSIQKTIEANYLTITFDAEPEFDEISIKALNTETPDFLLPFTMTSSNGVISFRYKLKNFIALEYAADYSSQKKDFIKLFKGLITPMLEGKDWFLDYHYLCIDPRYVYVDRESGKAYFIYVPEKSYANTDDEIFAFLKNVFDKTTIVDDPAFQVQMYKFFGNESITLSSLYETIKNEEGKGKINSGVGNPQDNRQSGTYNPIQQPNPAGDPSNRNNPYNANKPAGNAGIDTMGKKPDNNRGPEPKKEEHGGIFGFGKKKEKDDKSADSLFKNDSESKKQADPANKKTDDDVLSLLGEKPKKEDKSVKKEKKEKGLGFAGLFGKKEPDQKADVKNGSGQQSQPQNNNFASDPFPYDQGNYDMNPAGLSGAMGYTGAGAGEGEKTETFADSSSAAEPCLTLVSSPISGAIQKISLNFDKPYITIGRMSSSEPVQPDVAFSSDFRRIGRRHARIARRGNDYFLIDLGSQNKTLYNNQVIVANTEIKLVNGAEIAFTESMPVVYRVNL